MVPSGNGFRLRQGNYGKSADSVAPTGCSEERNDGLNASKLVDRNAELRYLIDQLHCAVSIRA